MTTAASLAAAAAERAKTGAPETLAQIIARTRYAAEWKLEQARKHRASADGFRKMATVDEYTLQQREDARVAAGSLLERAFADEDASRILDSIADALIAVTG